jgi:hypothetical protein
LRAQKAVLRSILEQLVLASCSAKDALWPRSHSVQPFPRPRSPVDSDKRLKFSGLRLGRLHAFTHSAATAEEAQNAMTTIDSGINQNQIQKSLVPMLRTWTHSIGWTVLLSTLLAVLFALAVDGCANIH